MASFKREPFDKAMVYKVKGRQTLTGLGYHFAELVPDGLGAYHLKRPEDFVVCAYCGEVLPYNCVEIDHIRPVSEGGVNDVSNLVAACPACNRSKSGQSAWMWYTRQDFYSEARVAFLEAVMGRPLEEIDEDARRAIEVAISYHEAKGDAFGDYYTEATISSASRQSERLVRAYIATHPEAVSHFIPLSEVRKASKG